MLFVKNLPLRELFVHEPMKYPDLRKIWLILVESSRIEVFLFSAIYVTSFFIWLWSIYKSFTESSKNSTFILKNLPNIQHSTWYSTRYSTRYSTWGEVTRPWSINFTIRLWLNFGHRLLVFALTTNFESGPRFANIW